MKFWIYILSVIILSACGAAEMQDSAKMVDYAPEFPNHEKDTSNDSLNLEEMEEYLQLKMQDVMELQEVIHNPELDQEMKEYAKDMILKIFPNEILLRENFKIEDFYFSASSGKEIIRSDGFRSQPLAINVKIDNDTINVRINPMKTENGIQFSFQPQIY